MDLFTDDHFPCNNVSVSLEAGNVGRKKGGKGERNECCVVWRVYHVQMRGRRRWTKDGKGRVGGTGTGRLCRDRCAAAVHIF